MALKKSRIFQPVNKLIALFSVFFLISCFPGEESQQTGSVEQQIQIQQTTAVSYARMFQQYAALSQQYLMKDVWEDGVVELPANGLIGSKAFANLYNVDKASEFLESAYCDMGKDQFHISWFKGDVIGDDASKGGGSALIVERKDLKGLGKSGYGNIMKVMAREMSPRSYGSYDKNELKLGDGSVQQLTCAATSYIPTGIPVIVSAVKSSAVEQTREYFAYDSLGCKGEGEMGIKRTRVKMKQVFDEKGNPVGKPEQIGEPEIIVDACQTNPGTPQIQISSNMADVVDFASAGLGGTIQANCFEATKVNAEGQPIDENGNVTDKPITFSNCEGSSYNFNPEDIPPGQNLSCIESAPIRTETRSVPCSGSGWTGNATYQREVYSCEVVDVSTGVGTGVFYEEAREWANQSISCTRPEETYFFCPSSDGTLRYSRTNVINAFTPGTFNPAPPTNPAWNYASGTCDLDVRDCSPRYLGLDRVADSNMPGSLERRSATNPHNIPGAQMNPINTLCGTGAVCTEIRDNGTCPVPAPAMAGGITQERTYNCTASNTGSWSHPAAPAPWLETSNTCACTGPTPVADGSIACPSGYTGSRACHRDRNPSTCALGPQICDSIASSCTLIPPPGECTPGDIDNDMCSDGVTVDRRRTCQGDETWGGWVDVDVCPACTNGDIQNETFCAAPNSTIRTGYEQCVGGVWVPQTDQTCPACTDGAIQNETFCAAPDSTIRTGYEQCVGGVWVPQTDQTCPAGECTAGSFEARGAGCPVGQVGVINERRDCQPNNMWGPWTETSNTCAPPACTPSWSGPSFDEALLDIGRMNATTVYYYESPQPPQPSDISRRDEYIEPCNDADDVGNISYTYYYDFQCVANMGMHYCDFNSTNQSEDLRVCECN